MDAFYVVGDDPAESLGAINPLVERKNLLKMQQAVRYLAKTIRELHVQTFQQLVDECSALGDLSGESSRDLMPLVRKDPNFWIYFWGAAFVLDEVVDKITPSISDHIETAPVAGRRNLANVTAIESLRDIWEDRKKTPAPMNITDAGPFADFLIEAFEALGLEGNPRAAMDSWREYRAKYPR